MSDSVRFPFTIIDPHLGALGQSPYLPLTLTYGDQSLVVQGLLDTGSSVNVLPHGLGIQLGAIWENQRVSLPLGGNLARFEARALLVKATVNGFEPVELAFAWTQDRHVPLILGHMNFFLLFDVCFYRAELAFDITQRSQLK
jgi:hypothetical protein